MSNNAKDLRKQIRNVVQEILPEILTAELVEACRKEFTLKIEARLDAITKHLSETLGAIQRQQQETQSYVIRNLPTRNFVQPTPSRLTDEDIS